MRSYDVRFFAGSAFSRLLIAAEQAPTCARTCEPLKPPYVAERPSMGHLQPSG